VPPVKKGWANTFGAAVDDWLSPVTELIRNWQKLHDITKNNYELGLHHLRLQNISDAVLRFRFVTWLDPKHADGWYYLGISYMAERKTKQALNAFRHALRARPKYEEAAYMLAVARGNSTPYKDLPKKIPLSLTENYFDDIAPQFTEDQIDTMGYKGHILLAEAMRPALMPGRIDHMILELGVGTGLLGPEMRKVAAQIIGVDLSNAMLAEAMRLRDAEGHKIYDALIKREMVAFMMQSPQETYDIVMAANVLGYVGDVQPVFDQVARVLAKGGLFAFTAESMPDTDEGGCRFVPSGGHFKYTRGYLQLAAQKAGLSEISMTESAVYPNDNAWICVLRK
jgi:predicted TPR repeat methyltransferase